MWNPLRATVPGGKFMRYFFVALLLTAAGCSQDVTSPGAAGADAGSAAGQDAGANPGQDAGPAGDPGREPASIDAGFVVEVPEPPQGDRCREICDGARCEEMCQLTCRLGESGVPADQREAFRACAQQNPCEIIDCVPDELPVPEACNDICANQERMDNCDVSLLADSPAEVCGVVCASILGRMEPANRQAWLDCTANRCLRGDRIDCDPDAYYGPTPSRDCVEAGRRHALCDGVDDHWFREAWRCEAFRSPGTQPDRAGDALVQCLAETNACHDERGFVCMEEVLADHPRGDEVRNRCAAAAACGEDLGMSCVYFSLGITVGVGGQLEEVLDRCLLSAGSDCEQIDDCLDTEVGVEDRDSPCASACADCGDEDDQVDCREDCVEFQNSMSVSQAAAFGDCLPNNSCIDVDDVARCAAVALPEEAGLCRTFWDAAQVRCNDWRQIDDAEVEVRCLQSIARTGVMSEDALLRCANQLNCESDPGTACIKRRVGR